LFGYFPVLERNHRRLDVSDDFALPGHKSEDIVILWLHGNDLNDGLPAFGYNHRLARCLYVVHHCQTTRFESAGAHLFHGVFSMSMVILT